ncbi:VOC family protein [Gordonia bronchialis]|uniref:VOC family protein n=1 Tax=Gordonia bronchialis TaxID=2054 RepID=UPI002271639E|nr:VOC family protein [Gordonia bronchialis]
MDNPARHDIAHLGHVQLLTPTFDESLWFFTELLGMRQVESDGTSAYLRSWDDYEHHTITLTAHETSGVGTLTYRASSPEALERRVAAIEAAGLGLGWGDGEPGIGKTYHFTDPDGHRMDLYWETEKLAPPAEFAPKLKNQAERFPAAPATVRRLDHINYLAQNAESNGSFIRDVLGGRVTEQIRLDSGKVAGQWLTFTNKTYDVVYTDDWTGSNGRLHHVAFATDTREDILRACDAFLENGIFIETGPHKHTIQQTFFLYVWEPGGNRIEFCNPGARMILDPDWEVIEWTEAERAKGQAWGLKTIASFHTHGTPPVKQG